MANKLIDIYFTLFKMILEGHAGHAAAATKSQEEAAAAAQPKKNRHRCVECRQSLAVTLLLCQLRVATPAERLTQVRSARVAHRSAGLYF